MLHQVDEAGTGNDGGDATGDLLRMGAERVVGRRLAAQLVGLEPATATVDTHMPRTAGEPAGIGSQNTMVEEEIQLLVARNGDLRVESKIPVEGARAPPWPSR